ncbi:hypothetical protein, partial [Klebsiella quasipneumoniae]|uniref:hypothetical protein n=1 Tax=Klebsiella quasipneumoniae TaxID=1463165 RepID=UPI00194033AB
PTPTTNTLFAMERLPLRIVALVPGCQKPTQLTVFLASKIGTLSGIDSMRTDTRDGFEGLSVGGTGHADPLITDRTV